jgi:hypothetical protein
MKHTKPSQLDQLKETLTETRLKVLKNLENCIKEESMDSLEALQKLAACLLMNQDAALEYAVRMGNPKLWGKVYATVSDNGTQKLFKGA